MEYLWTKDVVPPRFPALEGDVDTDILVIGGGMAGVLCATLLQQAGADCVLAEAGRIGQGVTRGTTAVLTAQHDTLYQDLIRRFGAAKSKQYLHANLRAVERIRTLAQHIDCVFEAAPSWMYALHDRALMEREAKAVQSLGFPAFFSTETPLPLPVAGAVCYPGMAQFHPLRFLYGAARGLRILEDTQVLRLEGTTAVTPRGRIRAKQVVVATHFPFLNRRGLYFSKMYQKRSYVIALENAPKLDYTAVDAGEDGVYLRSYKDLLLVGGGDLRTGKKGWNFDIPRSFARRYFPGSREVCAWANQDCVTLDGAPYIGPYSPALPNVFVASGFGLWGMSTAMVAAQLLTDLVLGRENPDAAVFAPDRPMAARPLFSNLAATLGNFVIPTVKRCPHLGCALRWNPVEHSWDCPCHGSRFDADGALLDNPAQRDAKVRRK